MAEIIGTPGDDTLVGTAGSDTIKGRAGDDTITGGSGKYTLLGGTGNDIIDGGAGNDIIWGGAGDDTLTGGAGKDTFVIESNSGNDTITDFQKSDIINVIDPAITDYASFIAALVDDGSGNSTLTLTDGTTVTFIGYTSADFKTAQVSFAPVPCFAAGMQIQTPDGPRPIENIRAGDLVETVGHGPRPVRWAGRARVRFGAGPHRLKPVLIRAGALAAGVPDVDLVVSPQHRILISDWRCELLFGMNQVLAPAKGLVNGRDIFRLDACRAVDFVHILFERHEIVTVNGTQAESLYPGTRSMNGLGAGASTEIRALFADLRGPAGSSNWQLARPEITVREAKMLAACGAVGRPIGVDLRAAICAKMTTCPPFPTCRDDPGINQTLRAAA
jgi:hypothetical protein